MFGLGVTELLVILVIALLLFGSRLPKVGRSLGAGIRDFKMALSGAQDDGDTVQKPPQNPRPPQTDDTPKTPKDF